jgi:ribosomal protein L5
MTKKGISDIIIYAELNVEKVGWRGMDLLIHTRNRKSNSIANRLLENKEVVYVGKNIGEYTIVWLSSK